MQKCTRVHARGSGLTLFLLGGSCLELGSSQGPQMDHGSMKGNTSPCITGLHAEELVLQVWHG